MEEVKKSTIRGKEDKDERFFSRKEIERLKILLEVDISFLQGNVWLLEEQVVQIKIWK